MGENILILLNVVYFSFHSKAFFPQNRHWGSGSGESLFWQKNILLENVMLLVLKIWCWQCGGHGFSMGWHFSIGVGNQQTMELLIPAHGPWCSAAFVGRGFNCGCSPHATMGKSANGGQVLASFFSPLTQGGSFWSVIRKGCLPLL